jgi:hypothetical protein
MCVTHKTNRIPSRTPLSHDAPQKSERLQLSSQGIVQDAPGAEAATHVPAPLPCDVRASITPPAAPVAPAPQL